MNELAIDTGYFNLGNKEELFCQSIANGKGLAESYRMAISPRLDTDAAEERAMTLIRNNDAVSDRIQYLYDNRRIFNSLNRVDIVADMARMSDVSPADYFDFFDGSFVLKDPSTWTPIMKKACNGIEPTKFGIKIKLCNKEFLIKEINNALGITQVERAPLVLDAEYQQMSDEQLMQITGG